MANDVEALTAEVKAFLLRGGADLVGMAPVERFAKAPQGRRPQDLLPEARNVAVFAMDYLESSFLSPNPRVPQSRHYELRWRTQALGYDLCKFLERRGHRAVNLPSAGPLDVSPEARGFWGDFSYRHAAVEAGLGEIGWNNLLITPQFGPRVMLMAVITTAPLSPDPRFEGKLCPAQECALCITACPAGALTPADAISTDRSKCVRVQGKWGLYGLLKHLKEISRAPDLETRENIMLGPKTWGLWMDLHYGEGPEQCHLCMQSCPVGRTP